jgi:amino acid transporter
LSMICILAGGVTSFHLGLCSVGGASIGLGWPLVALFSLVVAATMGQLASTFPTAGGLYHWSSILGGRGWGWATAWFNLAGLVTVLAAINVGTYRFALGAFGPPTGTLTPWSDGLATVTSASRMAYAFARDGEVPFSQAVRWVCPRRRSPAVGIWTVSTAAVLFTLYTPVYSTITAVCTILLYISYALPTALGARAHGRTWTTMGPWHLGHWFRPLAWASVAGCLVLIGIGVQPPNERALRVVGGMVVVLGLVWIGGERSRFPGPPHLITIGSGLARPLEADLTVETHRVIS